MPQSVIGIVEDDPDQLLNYQAALDKKGFKTLVCQSMGEALEIFKSHKPDLVILDIVLGDEVDGGFELCRSLLQEDPMLPVIFLTDRVDEVDQVSGLRMGAWDYETKPISLAFLAEKVSALLRIRDLRNNTDKTRDSSSVVKGDLALDEERMKVAWKGEPVGFTLTEFRLLAELAKKPGHVFSYDTLMESALQTVVAHNTINTHIRNIRSKFTAVDKTFDCIENEYALGYRWKCEEK